MKYACGVVGSIRNTVTGWPFVPGFDSVPARPSNGWPDVDTLPGYRNPSMWSKDLFSSIRSTTLLTAARPLPLAIPCPLRVARNPTKPYRAHPAIGRELPLDTRLPLGAPAAAALGGQARHGPGHLDRRGRLRQPRRIVAPEGIQGQGDEPPPGVRRIDAGDLHDRGRGDQQEQEVLADEVVPQRAAGLGAIDERDDVLVGRPAELLDLLTGGQRHRQQIAKTAVAGLQFADPLHEPGEPGPRIRDLQSLLGSIRVLGDLLRERCRDELLAGGEPPVQRGDPDAGPGGDHLKRSLEPLLGEDVPGHRQDRGAVAGGIGAQPACACRSRGCHPLMVDDLEAPLRNLLASGGICPHRDRRKSWKPARGRGSAPSGTLTTGWKPSWSPSTSGSLSSRPTRASGRSPRCSRISGPRPRSSACGWTPA